MVAPCWRSLRTGIASAAHKKRCSIPAPMTSSCTNSQPVSACSSLCFNDASLWSYWSNTSEWANLFLTLYRSLKCVCGSQRNGHVILHVVISSTWMDAWINNTPCKGSAVWCLRPFRKRKGEIRRSDWLLTVVHWAYTTATILKSLIAALSFRVREATTFPWQQTTIRTVAAIDIWWKQRSRLLTFIFRWH